MLKNFFLKKMHTKDKASSTVEALLVFAVSLTLFMSLLVITMCAFSNINNKWKIKQCAREYLLIAETQGCLTEEDLKNMKNELNSYGLESIDFSGTDLSAVSYGEQVTVMFKGTYNNRLGDETTNYLTWLFKPEELSVIRVSTSKY